MRKPVADKTETAVAYLAARFWFVGSRISHVTLHGFLPRQPGLRRHRRLWPGQFVAREVGWDLLKAIYWQIKIVFLAQARGIDFRGGSAAEPGGPPSSKPRRMPREFYSSALREGFWTCLCDGVRHRSISETADLLRLRNTSDL